MVTQGLKASERIRRRPEFECIYSTGSRLSGRFMTVFVLPNDRPTARFGVAATRKLGGAVERNRVKRLAREVFRRHKPAAGHDVVIVPRREMLDASFPNLEADFYDILQRYPRDGSRPAPRRPRGRRAAPASRL